MKLLNSLSLNMVPPNCKIRVWEVNEYMAADTLSAGHVENCIGHADTDAVVRAALLAAGSAPLPLGQRITVSLLPGDYALVAQYIGPRLAEGTTVLPKGARIEYRMVEII